MAGFQKLVYLLTLCALPFGITLADDDAVTLWEVKGRQNTVYLLGSIHLLRERDYPLPAVIEAAYQDAEVVVMEIDMDDIDPMGSLSLLSSAGMIQDDRTLRDLMGEAAWKRAETAAAEIEIPLNLLGKVEPWYAAITVEIMALSRIGFDANYGVETYFTNKSVADNKPIEGLETLEEQIQFLDGLSLEAQRAMLVSTLEDSAELSAIMDQMIAAWRDGDTAFFESEILGEFAEFEELHEEILVKRNNRWMTQVTEMLQHSDDYLVVVGAMHLIGADGLPQQLERRGITARQLSKSSELR